MNIFRELQPHIDAFKATRDHVVASGELPSTGGGVDFGQPPFVIDDGVSYYAVIDANGDVSPLPFGYQIDEVDIELDGSSVVYSEPMSMAGEGMGIVRYVPLVADFEMPGERAFCLEAAEDSEAWGAVSQMVDAVQQIVNEKALFNFNQRLSNAVVSLYERIEGLESVDQALAGLFVDSSLLSVLILGSYRHALDEIEEELGDEEYDDADE